MSKIRLSSMVRALLVMFALGTAMEMVAPSVAEARAGRGRSFGRSARPSSPPPSQPSRNYNNDNNGAPQQGMNPNRGGGFMRNVAGGLAGGFLGSMLFSSIARGSGMGGGGGGIGLFEIILLAGLAYFGLRWWKNRQQQQTASAMARGGMNQSFQTASYSTPSQSTFNTSSFRALAPVAIDTDTASDIFFKVQGAWTRRDLSPVASLLGADMKETLTKDVEELKRNKEINRLENISVRGTNILESWEEGDQEFSTVRFTANLLDYTVSETSGQVVDGSDNTPVKFEEDWTFAKSPQANAWQLVGIQQV